MRCRRRRSIVSRRPSRACNGFPGVGSSPLVGRIDHVQRGRPGRGCAGQFSVTLAAPPSGRHQRRQCHEAQQCARCPSSRSSRRGPDVRKIACPGSLASAAMTAAAVSRLHPPTNFRFMTLAWGRRCPSALRFLKWTSAGAACAGKRVLPITVGTPMRRNCGEPGTCEGKVPFLRGRPQPLGRCTFSGPTRPAVTKPDDIHSRGCDQLKVRGSGFATASVALVSE